jgi:hypothetical protein
MSTLVLLLCLASSDRFSAVFLDDGQAILEGAPSVTLISLSPESVPLFSFRPSTRRGFHGYRILGSTEVGGEAKSELLGKLYTALAEDAQPNRCFNPRHGIRATAGERHIDLVICFECKQVQSFVYNKKSGAVIGASAAETFDKILRAARVPLSEK